ncbi:UvrD-helicase domain-containing protein [Clostridium sp. BJN0001]|uniref:HelD family protein n=1 Tax=Clostridium sp. BJN0001 TaxID=2930219 RepID=UPI001FD19D58|nr:UvrD-helicase domain-containing protein [Clostridium sp. BJN0001]
MNKTIEFITEENKFIEVSNIIKCEIADYLERRKNVTKGILEARQQYLEEHKTDDEEVSKYFDHEEYVKEESYKTIDKRLIELTKLKECPYFGKIVCLDDDDQIFSFYIGKYGLTLEDSFEPVIVDWRAPIAALFYKGVLGNVKYTVPNGEENADIKERKQIVIKKGELKGVFDSELDVKDEILQMVLTEHSSDKLKDIVMTIQKEQDEIIRQDKNKVIVVNGVAGSGKTTIALHRVSYLLYNFRKQLGDKVLIFGPNDIFMDYIAQVLPSLGESNIAETTFENFAKNIVKITDDSSIEKYSTYMEKVMDGDEESLIDYRYKSSSKYYDKLNDVIEELNKNYFSINDVLFDGEMIVSKDEINEMFCGYYKNMPLFRRSEKIRRILTSKIKNKRDELYYKLLKEIDIKIKNLSEEEKNEQINNILFKKKIKIKEIIRKVIEARKNLDLWLKHEDVKEIYKKYVNNNKITYMDLVGMLYLEVKLCKPKLKREIKHIVIDEAQDYTFIQFEIIKEITGCKSYTIVGDSNQRLALNGEDTAMTHLGRIFKKEDNYNIAEFYLKKSYRSTQEIMEYANKSLTENKIVPLVRHGGKVIEENDLSKEEMLTTLQYIIEDYEEDGLSNIAVIFSNKAMLYKYSEEIKEGTAIQKLDNEDLIYKGGKVLIPAYLAKGLEFDAVIIIQDNKENINPLVKYIMCTRALHRLAVLNLK